MRDQRGLTLLEILLLMVMVGTAIAALATRSWRPFLFLLSVYAILFAVLAVLALAIAWIKWISIPRHLRTLDRLEQETDEGQRARLALDRLRDLLKWMPVKRGLSLLKARVDRDGPFRREYLGLVDVYRGSEQARELLRGLAESSNPLASMARDLLAQEHDEQGEVPGPRR